MNRRVAPLLMTLLVGLACHAADDATAALRMQPVRLVANDWCPQHCASGKPGQGFIVDVVTAALRAEKLSYVVEYRPWLRAMAETAAGKFDGLLTPIANSYPQFNYHQEAVGYQEYCLYTRAEDSWQYKVHADLLGRQLAFLKDSGFGALDDYLRQHREQIRVHEFPDSGNYAQRLFAFLASKRTDVVIITSDVYAYAQQQKQIRPAFRTAGCLGAEKLTVGLSKTNPARSKALGEALDRGLRGLRKSGELQRITSRYGVPSW